MAQIVFFIFFNLSKALANENITDWHEQFLPQRGRSPSKDSARNFYNMEHQHALLSINQPSFPGKSRHIPHNRRNALLDAARKLVILQKTG